MRELPREIFTRSWRANKRLRARVAGRALRPITSTLASVSLILGALAGGVVALSPATAAAPVKSCAEGGPCALGDTGPGGGLVFLISDGIGYEMAPNTWTGTSSDDTPGQKFCVRIYATLTNTIGLGGAAATAKLLEWCKGGAPVAATAYRGGGLTDWFVPNPTEMNSMCNYSRTWSGSPSTSACTAGSQDPTFASSNYGFTDGWYWTSLRRNNYPWAYSFNEAQAVGQSSLHNEGTLLSVRPIRSFAVPPAAQTVTWDPTRSITTSTTAPSVVATTDGNGVISYAVTDAGTTGCTVNSSTAAVTFTGAGSCQITASATATTTYTATSTAVTFTVALTPQPITVSAAASTLAAYATTALSTSGVVGTGQVTYSVASGGSFCSISGSTLTALGTGTCEVTSSVAADSFYAAATSSAITITVPKATQTITWAPSNTSLSFSDSPVTPSVGATSDGDGVITYAVTSAGTTGCTVNSNTGTLTYSATGTCVVRATAALSTAYESGTKDVTFTIAAESPTTPTITSASAGDATATVAFSVPSSNGGATITGYTATASPGVITGTCTSSPCTITGLSNTASYTITVTATNSAGTSSASLVSPSVSPAESTGAVENLSVAPGDKTLAVSWVAPACLRATPSTCGTLTGYEVFTSTGSNVWVSAGTTMSTNKTVTGLFNGTQYNVKVTVRTSTSSTEDVTGLSVTPADGVALDNRELQVSWSAPSCLGNSPACTLTGYEVFTSTNGTDFTQFGTSGTATSVTVTGLVSGTKYYVKVTVTTSTPSSNADALAQQVPATTPSAPTGVVVARLTATTVSVGWSAPSSDGGQAITEYTVTATSPTGVTVVIPSSSSPIALTGLTDGATYTVVVSATNLMDKGPDSEASAAVTMGLTAQTITAVPASDSMTALTSILLSSSGSSGSGAKIFTVSSGPCSVSGAALTATATGTCVVTATIAADVLNAAATSTGVSVTVTPAIQTVSWSPTTVFTAVQTPTLDPATSNGNGSLVYSVTSAGTANCSFSSGSTLVFTAAGTCAVQAIAGSSATYSQSAPITLTITVGFATRSITWSPTNTLVAADSGSAASPLATISTGAGTPTYTVSSAGLSGCTVNSTSAVISYTAPGSCVVVATAPANATYSATSTFVTFTISSAPQTVSWSPTTALTLSQSPVEVESAIGSGDGLITYAVTSQGTSDCTIESITGILDFTTAGQCLVTATAGANTGFTAGSTAVTFLLSKNSTVVPGPAPSSGGSSTPVIADNSVDAGKAVSVPGNASLFIGSSPVAMTVSANPANTGLDMSMGQWEVSIAPAVAATALPLGPQGELRTTQGQTLEVSGSSYLRRTTVNIYIMSTPILIGAAQVSAQGNFTTTVTIPATMRLGTHTLQIVGVNPGNETSRASLGITVLSATADASVVTSPIGTQVGFKKNTAKLTKRSATSVNSLVGQVPTGSTSLRARVVMFMPTSASRYEVKLNKQRQRTVVNALRAAGYAGEITTKVIKKKSKQGSKKGSQGNAITIWFSTPNIDQNTV